MSRDYELLKPVPKLDKKRCDNKGDIKYQGQHSKSVHCVQNQKKSLNIFSYFELFFYCR